MKARTSRFTGAVCLSLALASTLVVAGSLQQRPVFRAGASFVTVDVYPHRDGKIVEGLTQADFDVFEDGTPQKVESFEFVRIEPSRDESARRDPNTAGEALTQAADPHNRVFVIYLDRLHVQVDGSRNIRGPLVDTLNRIVAPNDLFAVLLEFRSPVDLVFGRRTLSIEEQLTRYWAWGERSRITRDPTDPVEQYLYDCFHYVPNRMPPTPWLVSDGAVMRYLDEILIERRREDRTLTSLEGLVAYLSGLREARTVVLIVTDGWRWQPAIPGLAEQAGKAPSGPPGVYVGPGGRLGTSTKLDGSGDRAQCNAELSRLATLDNERRSRDLFAAANRGNISFYPIAPSGMAVFDTPISQRVIANPNAPMDQTVIGREMDLVRGRVDSMLTLANNTDGIAIVNTNDVAGGLRRIVEDVSAYYLLGYSSTNTKFDGKLRKIQVKVKQPGLAVRARRSYVAPSEESLKRAVETPEAAAAAAARAPVDEALKVLERTSPTAEISSYAVASAGEIVVVTELASRQIELGRWPKGADVQVTVSGATAGATAVLGKARIDPGWRGALVRVPIAAGDAGPWHVNVRLLGGGGAALDDRIEVRASAGRVLGDPIVFRAAPAPVSPLRPVADFQFRRVERVHVEWPVLGTLDQRTARVLDRRGQPLALNATLTERPDAAGRPMLAADLNLAPLAEGDYVIEVVAGQGTQTERKLLAFRVIR